MRLPGFHSLFLALVIFLPSAGWAAETVVKTPHFDLASPFLAGRANIFAKKIDKAYELVGRMLSSHKKSDEKHLSILILPDQKEFLKQAGKDNLETTSLGGYFAEKTNKIVTWRRSDDAETLGVLTHELTHYLLKARMDNPPLWLNEGLAEYLEGSSILLGKVNTGRITQGGHGAVFLQAVTNGTLIPVSTLLGLAKYPAEHRDLFYAESWALVFYLWEGEHGKFQKKFSDYARTLAEGKDALAEFRLLFGEPIRFQRKWIQEMKKQTRSRSKGTHSTPRL